MKNELTVLEKNLPLRAYPPENLNRALVVDFGVWVSNLLSLSGEKAQERLELSLEAIRDNCSGMGFAEIRKMFEKYADSQMSIKPIPNYFDRVLVGQIVSEWKSTRPKVMAPEKVITQSEKDRIMLDAVDRVKREIQETGSTGSAHHIYDWLIETGRMDKPSENHRRNAFKMALEDQKNEIKKAAKTDYLLRKQLKNTLKVLGTGNELTIKKAKTFLISDFYK